MALKGVWAVSVIVIILILGMFAYSPIAYADDDDSTPIICENETLEGTIKDNILVHTTNGFNICVLNNVDLKGNIKVEENAAVFVIDGSSLRGDIKLEGKFSAVNFEGIDINSLKGNINAKENTYVFIESLNMDGNVNSKGEVFISSDNRFSGPVTIDGDIIISDDDDDDDDDGFKKKIPSDEFVIAGGTITGNVDVFRELSVRIFDAEIVGDLKIKFNENTSAVDSTIDVGFSTIGGNLEIKENSLSTIMISNNDISGHLEVKRMKVLLQ